MLNDSGSTRSLSCNLIAVVLDPNLDLELVRYLLARANTAVPLQVQSMDAKINLRPEESKLPKPGEKLNLRVSVPTNWKQPVRVTVIGAKIEEARKAALTKTNRKGKNRDSKLTLDLAADFVTTSSSHLLLAPKTENVLKKTYLDRLMLDPWTPMFADVG